MIFNLTPVEKVHAPLRSNPLCVSTFNEIFTGKYLFVQTLIIKSIYNVVTVKCLQLKQDLVLDICANDKISDFMAIPNQVFLS